MAGVIRGEMFRGRPYSIRLQLLQEDTGQAVTAALSTYSHRLIGKLSHEDPDASAVFNLTGIFTNEDDTLKIVRALIPMSATAVPAIPEGETTPLYLQWQTTDGSGLAWIVADGRLAVRSVLPRTP